MVDRKGPKLANRDEIKKGLKHALSDVGSGSFITSDSYHIGVNPGLEVLGVGPVGLPMSADIVKNIIQANASSYESTPQKAWELNEGQFFLRNPTWDEQIAKLLKAAVSGLGLKADPTQVRAELHNLMLYGEGAAFLPRQDSGKADGMFGTLVVSLPSKHEGGDVVASYEGRSQTFSSSLGSDFGFSYAAWYSNITHEMKPVTSGYRIVLTYNLIHHPSAKLLSQASTLTKLISLLESWANLCKKVLPTLDQPVRWFGDREDVCPTGLIYMLDQKYKRGEFHKPPKLSFTGRLTGVDQDRVAEIRKACDHTGFSVFLVDIMKSQTGPVEFDFGDRDSEYSQEHYGEPQHGISDIEESSLVLSHIIEPEDGTFATEVDIDDDAIFVQEHLFELEDPNLEEYSGRVPYGGDDTVTHLYRRTVQKNFHPPSSLRRANDASSNCAIVFYSTDTLG